MVKNPTLCVICKGARLLCGLKSCPILSKYSFIKHIKKLRLKKELYSESPPGFFVGRSNYPNVSVGPLVTLDNELIKEPLDEPDLWFGKPVEEIIKYRSSLFRSTFKVNIKNPQNKFLEESRLIAMASKPVMAEVKLNKITLPRLSFDGISAPWGVTGLVEKLTLTENPKIHPKIDYISSDGAISAAESIEILFKAGLSVNTITRILSAGLLGYSHLRRIVPTRWSITATDQIISNFLIERIKQFKIIDNILLFESTYLNNLFKILLVPSIWAFEQIEGWYPGSIWLSHALSPIIVSDFEDWRGRKKYASNVGGAYYASRLAVAEYLDKIRRQAAVLILREVRPEYTIPVGVWQIRENVRNSLKNKPLTFQDLNTALKKAISDFKIDFNMWISKSRLYGLLLKQKRIDSFLINF
ncbi:MAG: Nre family DNA repair protein [Candidatus Odinarchaeia archaeon]